MNTTSQQLFASLDLPIAMHNAAAELRAQVRVDQISFVLIAPETTATAIYLMALEDAPSLVEIEDEIALRGIIERGQIDAVADINQSIAPAYQVLAQHAPPDAWGRGAPLHAALICPLAVTERPFGSVNLTRADTVPFSAEEVASIQQVLPLIALALENARLYTRVRELAEVEQLVNRLSVNTARGDLSSILTNSLQDIGVTLGARVGRVRLQLPASPKREGSP